MYAITGVTGHVGGAAARALQDAGAPVRLVTRAVADLTDEAALTEAFRGCDGAFVLLPTIETLGDAGHRALADTIAAAVGAAGVPHVVMLSSLGADLAEGTGPIRWLHHLENRLRDTGTVLTAIRSPHFQEKAEAFLPAATGAGVFPVLADSADVPIPMVATRDVGAAVARALLDPPAGSEVVDLEAAAYTEREVAATLGALLGRELEVVVVPRPGWLEALTGAGVPAELAAELVELSDADGKGLLAPRGDRSEKCTTPLAETLRQLVGGPA